jgi:hypothetical protein
MDNSLIYFLQSKDGKYIIQNYNCCEYLGDGANKSVGKGIFYVGIPIIEISEFFRHSTNLRAYCELISIIFDVNYLPMPTEDALVVVQNENVDIEKIFILVDTKRHSNKRFNASYNIFRYIWYHKWENIGIIATNLFKLGIFDDPLDVLAIACSYQADAGRSLLPADTLDLNGLLYFRDSKKTMDELDKNNPFNTVFYRYPIFFDPEVSIKGSFFDNYETIIPSKRYIQSLHGILDIEEIPASAISTLKKIKDDYLLTKETYLKIYTDVEKNNKEFCMTKDSPLLLNKKNITNEKFTLVGVDPAGFETKVDIKI